jgi:hypothetical protein
MHFGSIAVLGWLEPAAEDEQVLAAPPFTAADALLS